MAGKFLSVLPTKFTRFAEKMTPSLLYCRGCYGLRGLTLNNFIEDRYNILLCWLIGPETVEAAGLFLGLCGDRAINVRFSPNGYTRLMDDLVYNWRSLDSILEYGPDLHTTGIDRYYSRFVETPTSLALYSSRAFSNWWFALDHINVDLQEFINLEMQQTPLVDAGWRTETLLDLFESGFQLGFDLWHDRYRWLCIDCSQEIDTVVVQPS